MTHYSPFYSDKHTQMQNGCKRKKKRGGGLLGLKFLQGLFKRLSSTILIQRLHIGWTKKQMEGEHKRLPSENMSALRLIFPACSRQTAYGSALRSHHMIAKNHLSPLNWEHAKLLNNMLISSYFRVRVRAFLRKVKLMNHSLHMGPFCRHTSIWVCQKTRKQNNNNNNYNANKIE